MSGGGDDGSNVAGGACFEPLDLPTTPLKKTKATPLQAEPKAVQPLSSPALQRALSACAELMLFAPNSIWQLLFERPHQHDAHHRDTEH